jgi:hypothetical protein
MSLQQQLKGTYGIAYSASTEQDQFCLDWAADYMSSRFQAGGKNDLQKIKDLGFNMVRLYYLDPNNSHQLFLQRVQEVGLKMEVPIHNGLIESRDYNGIVKLVNEVKNSPVVKVYTVGNEMDRSFNDNIAWAMDVVNQLDPSRPLIHSSIFDEGFGAMKAVISKLNSQVRSKFIGGVNMYFYGNPVWQAGDCIQGAVKNWFNDQQLANVPLIITETGYGGPNDDDQWTSIWNTLFGSFCCYDRHPLFLGIELFANQNEKWKGTRSNEHLYGIMTEYGTPRKAYYAVQDFSKSDAYRNMVNRYKF